MFIMKSEETLQKLQESSEYRSMYREIIRTQIQTLIDHLAVAGEESVLLTACTHENDVSGNTIIVGTELGQDFLTQENVLCKFKEFCLQKKQGVNEKICVSQSVLSSSGSLNISGKRKFSEVYDGDQGENAEVEQTTPKMETKRSRSRSMTPSLKLVKTEDASSPAGVDIHVPKGYSKCGMCNYMSKFKANVTRHERSIHKINIEGSTLVTAQYMCALCEYRSMYRANLVRHEKSVHKICSSNADIESRKIQVVQNGDGSSFTDADVNNFDSETGNQLYMNQTGSEIENIGNKSFDNIREPDLSISQIKQNYDLSDAKIGNQTVRNDGNDSSTESFEYQSNIESPADVDGCHICNYCQLLFNSKSKLLEHVDDAHLKSDLVNCEKMHESETGLQTNIVTQNAPKQEVCKCGKAFQYRASLIRHERKCEFWTTSERNNSQVEHSEMSETETVKVNDEHDTTVTESGENYIE